MKNDALKLFEKLLMVDPKRRISATDALNSDFFYDYDPTAGRNALREVHCAFNEGTPSDARAGVVESAKLTLRDDLSTLPSTTAAAPATETTTTAGQEWTIPRQDILNK